MKQENRVLLVMDVQKAIVGALKESSGVFFEALDATIKAARAAKIPVFFVVVGFRKGYPESSSRNKSFRAIRESGRQLDSPEGCEIDSHITPLPGELIITKKRVSAFTGSDLEVALRSMEIHHLVLTGISTSGVVLSTLREAADKDFEITVLSDCCADTDPEVHSILMTKVFPRQAEVMAHRQWIENL